MAQIVKSLPAAQETWVQSLGWEDPTGEGKAIYSSILAWRIPWTEEPGGLQFMGSQRVRQDCATFTLSNIQGVSNAKFIQIFLKIEDEEILSVF